MSVREDDDGEVGGEIVDDAEMDNCTVDDVVTLERRSSIGVRGVGRFDIVQVLFHLAIVRAIVGLQFI